MPIPRRIVQTGREAKQPLRSRAAMASAKALNPGFEHLFFDDGAVRHFVQTEFPQYAGVFDGFPYNIQRIDFFRYLAIYRLGGFYLDLDVFLAEPLEGLADLECVFPFEGLTLSGYLRRELQMDWEIGNFAFGAAAGHPFLGAVIENCVRAQRDAEWAKPMLRDSPPFFSGEFSVLTTTGPGLISRTLAESGATAGTVTVLFPDDVCDSRCWNRFGDFGIHLMEGSWRTKGGLLQRKLALRWEARRLKALAAESARLGKTRTHGPPFIAPTSAAS